MTFKEWLRAVDAELEERCGLNTGDLDDCVNFRTVHRDNRTPTEAANIAMAEWGFYDNPLVVTLGADSR